MSGSEGVEGVMGRLRPGNTGVNCGMDNMGFKTAQKQPSSSSESMQGVSQERRFIFAEKVVLCQAISRNRKADAQPMCHERTLNHAGGS